MTTSITIGPATIYLGAAYVDFLRWPTWAFGRILHPNGSDVSITAIVLCWVLWLDIRYVSPHPARARRQFDAMIRRLESILETTR